MRYKKKGSLNLSINAIVVLILAVTMLGLGLGFMKTMFGKATEQFGEVSGSMKQQIIDEIKSSNEKLALNVFDVELKRGDSKKIYFGLKNVLPTSDVFNVLPDTNPGLIILDGSIDTSYDGSTIQCYTNYEGDDYDGTAGGDPIEDQIQFKTAQSISISAGETKVISMNIIPTSDAKLTTYSCAIYIDDPVNPGKEYARKDFEITVNS